MMPSALVPAFNPDMSTGDPCEVCGYNAEGTQCECTYVTYSPVSTYGLATPLVIEREPHELYGYALATGDFDGNGYDDLAVGVPGAERYGDGAVDVLMGSRYGLIPTYRYWSGYHNTGFGKALAVFDFDQDGYDDLVIGAPAWESGKGFVRVVRGTASGPAIAESQYIHGLVPGAQFGASLATGRRHSPTPSLVIPFLAVGAPSEGDGKIYVYSQPSTASQLVFKRAYAPEGLESGADFGRALATGSSLSFSSDDILVGAPGEQRVYFLSSDPLVLGSAPPFDDPLETVLAPEGDAPGFGEALALGSLGQAGYRAIVGARGERAVYGFDVNVIGDHFGEQRFKRTSERRGFGAAVVGPVDLFPGADVVDRILVGAHDVVGANSTVATFEGDGPDAVVPRQELGQRGLSQPLAGDVFGTAIAVGDFNGDASLDVAVGAPGEDILGDPTRPNAGAVFTYRREDRSGQWDIPDPTCALLIPWKNHTSSGGTGEGVWPVVDWDKDETYLAGDFVRHGCAFYRALVDHTSSDENQPPTEGFWSAQALPFVVVPTWTTFDADDWIPSVFGALSVDSDRKTEGTHSLRVDAPGFVELTSPAFATNAWPEIGSTFRLDVFVPAAQPLSGYQGAVQMYLSIPGEGQIHQYVGQVELTPLPAGQWHTVEIPIPAYLQDALLGTYEGALLHISVNTAPESSGDVQLDNLRFGGTLVPHSAYAPATEEPDFVCSGPCLDATPLAVHQDSGSFGTMDARWFVASAPLLGWQASEVTGRTIHVNGALVTPGQMQLPAPVDGKYYFEFSAGQFPWSSFSYW
jgi:hypothetical protein